MAVTDQIQTDDYSLYNGDCCEVIESLPDNSVHMSVYSPPFATEGGGALYNYSSSDRDFTNSRTYEEFFEQYEFLVKQMHRVLLPGRIVAVHCMDVPKKGANICGYNDFPGDIIRLHQRLGFEYLPRICIWKEPLAVRNRTMSKALAHRQIVEDACQTNVAAADYLIPFRKVGENPIPVTNEHGLMYYAGEREIPHELLQYRGWKGKQTENRYSHWIWRQYASCFWDDIRLDNVLPYKEARDDEDERHQHPLQLDVIERCVQLWSNHDEIVFSPFAGVGSEVFGAVKAGRKGIGVELKPSYFNQATENVKLAYQSDDQGVLFGREEPSLT
jgi:DNA modification methylase